MGSLLSKILGRASAQMTLSEAAQVLIDSLKIGAEDWKSDDGGHWLINERSDARIWVSNEDYGLKVESRDGRWVPSGPERAAIWDAAKELMTAHGHVAARRMAERLDKR